MHVVESPKTYVDLNSPGVVILDTTVVPDVIGLHAFNDEAALVRVLPGVSSNIVRILVPDDLSGFHDLLIKDMSATIIQPAFAGELTELLQHWPPSLLSVMTKRQVDMEAQRQECKCQFGNLRPGKCPSRHEFPSGFRSAVAVSDSMVICVEGGRSGLRGPSPSPPLRWIPGDAHIMHSAPNR